MFRALFKSLCRCKISVYGTLIGPPTAVLTTFIYGRLLKYGLWNKDKDEADFEEMQEESTGGFNW